MPAPSSRSIGQVLKVLKEDFEDISISKIRFLEGEGLVSPERAPASSSVRHRSSRYAVNLADRRRVGAARDDEIRQHLVWAQAVR